MEHMVKKIILFGNLNTRQIELGVCNVEAIITLSVPLLIELKFDLLSF
jgi:hypothetical protein